MARRKVDLRFSDVDAPLVRPMNRRSFSRSTVVTWLFSVSILSIPLLDYWSVVAAEFAILVPLGLISAGSLRPRTLPSQWTAFRSVPRGSEDLRNVGWILAVWLVLPAVLVLSFLPTAWRYPATFGHLLALIVIFLLLFFLVPLHRKAFFTALRFSVLAASVTVLGAQVVYFSGFQRSELKATSWAHLGCSPWFEGTRVFCRAQGVFHEPSYAAIFLGLFLGILIRFDKRDSKTRSMIIVGILALLSTAALSAVLFLVVLSLPIVRMIPRAFRGKFAALVVAGAALSPFLGVASRISSTGRSSDMGRLYEPTKLLFRVFRGHPFGVGLGRWGELADIYNHFGVAVVIGSAGVFGVVAFGYQLYLLRLVKMASLFIALMLSSSSFLRSWTWMFLGSVAALSRDDESVRLAAADVQRWINRHVLRGPAVEARIERGGVPDFGENPDT